MLPLTRGGRPRRLDARAILRHLAAICRERGLAEAVELRQGCAGGCWLPGPNVSVAIHPLTPPGERPDHVAIGWKTYVASLPDLPALDAIIDDNIF